MKKFNILFGNFFRNSQKDDESRSGANAQRLISVIDSKNYEHLEELIKLEKLDPNSRLEDGTTPLIYACRINNEKAAEVLLKNKANPNLEDKLTGYTPVFYAIANGNYKLLEMLFEHGADPNYINHYHVSPLIFACRSTGEFTRSFEMALFLVEHGANIYQKHINGKTAIQIAEESFGKEKAEQLIEAYKARIKKEFGRASGMKWR